MANKEQIVAAVDIGTTKIVAIVGRINENRRLEILGMGKTLSRGVKRGVVLNIEETVGAIESTVNDAKAMSKINFSEVFVGIAGQHIKSIRNRGYINRDSYEDEITRKDIVRMVEDMRKIPVDVGEEIIHVLPQNFIVDNEAGVKNPIGMSGKRLEANFHIVVGQVASAKNIEKCINRVGLNVKQLILEPLASSEAVLTEDEKEAGVVLVDIGGGTTDVAVYYDDIIRHTAVIPFGGNVVTRDIKEGCSILQRQAEALKMQFGSALGDLAKEDKVVTIPGISGRDPKEISFKSLAYIIQSRMEEIIDAVMFEVENSGYMDKLSAGIVITGGGALLRHLPQLVKFKTGMDVRIGYPNERLVKESHGEVNQPMYSTSIGLLLKGYEFLQENCQETAVDENIAVEVNEEKEIQKPRTRIKPKVKLIDSLKNAFTDIFDDESTRM
ncbi:MAG: cell division protein FtsA [Bacteroidales bacterium]|nr:cell division protein FtsA [Bacteroidales bacterium]